MKPLRSAILSLMLLTAPISVVWGDESGKENPQIAKTASQVNMPDAAKSKESSHAAQVRKDKEKMRKIVLAKKKQRQANKKTEKKVDPKKAVNKSARPPKKETRTTKRPPHIPTRMGIRTWAFPESAAARTSKITELTARITETENAYDAENTKFQKLQKQSKEQAKPASKPGNTPLPDAQLAASQRRINEILIQLDALHNQRNEVAGLVFLKTVRD